MNESRRIERRVGLRDLRVLVSVIESGSMGKAARMLATSQPAISRSIANLEHTFGVRLLDRSAYGVEPTLYGRALLRRGIAVFDELGQGLKDVRFLANPNVGDLAIATSIAIGVGFISNAIRSLSRRYPRLNFQILASDTTTAHGALLDRKVDFAVLHAIEPISLEHVDVETLLLDPHVVVAGAQNPLARRRRLKLADLVDERWVLPPPGSPYAGVVSEVFRASGLAVPSGVVSSTWPVRAALLATDNFLSMVPRIAMQFPPRKRLLGILPVDLPQTAKPLALMTLKNRTLNPAVGLLINQLRDTTKRAAKAVRA